MIAKRLKSTINKARAKLHERLKSRHRSSQWDEVRDLHLLEHAQCEACGSKKSLQVHHIIPFHVNPSKELEPSNLLTLCMGELDCHLMLGHGGSFRYYNPDVLEDSKKFVSITSEERLKMFKEIRSKRSRV